jgi:general secretion pathway protein I
MMTGLPLQVIKVVNMAGPAGESGFTLLEVMVAVAIIAISFVSLLGSQSQSISIATISRFETAASMLAKKKLAEIGSSAAGDLSGSAGDFEDDFSDFHWQTEVNDLTEEETGIPGAEDMLKVVDLVVSRGDDENMVYRVRTVVMARIEPVEKQ